MPCFLSLASNPYTIQPLSFSPNPSAVRVPLAPSAPDTLASFQFIENWTVLLLGLCTCLSWILKLSPNICWACYFLLSRFQLKTHFYATLPKAPSSPIVTLYPMTLLYFSHCTYHCLNDLMLCAYLFACLLSFILTRLYLYKWRGVLSLVYYYNSSAWHRA